LSILSLSKHLRRYCHPGAFTHQDSLALCRLGLCMGVKEVACDGKAIGGLR
jgi:hypothetical protein